MESVPLLDRAGRRRSPATLSSFHHGRPPQNKGLRYPPDPPTVEEIIAVMRAAGDGPDGIRLRGVIIVLWRAGLRISEVLALTETDLDRQRGAVLIRAGKGGRRRGRDGPLGLGASRSLARTPHDPTRRRVVLRTARPHPRPAMRPAGIRGQLRSAAEAAGVRRRFAPHQLRHAHAVEMSREGISLLVIQRQLGHADLGITSAYLRGIDNTEIIHAVHERPAPMIPAGSTLARRR